MDPRYASAAKARPVDKGKGEAIPVIGTETVASKKLKAAAARADRLVAEIGRTENLRSLVVEHWARKTAANGPFPAGDGGGGQDMLSLPALGRMLTADDSPPVILFGTGGATKARPGTGHEVRFSNFAPHADPGLSVYGVYFHTAEAAFQYGKFVTIARSVYADGHDRHAELLAYARDNFPVGARNNAKPLSGSGAATRGGKERKPRTANAQDPDARVGKNLRQAELEYWNAGASVRVMMDIMRVKFARGTDDARILLDTGRAFLAEDTSKNVVWGTGTNGRGKNLLGLVLMQIRAELGAE
jgi:predicted NAD-dependent protein-ADP-ribosyltransferase YbiA (DUF1768 family)